MLSRLLLILLLMPGLRLLTATEETHANQTGERADRIIQVETLDKNLLAMLVLAETNRYRVAAGRPELQWLDPLGVAANDHAKAMVTHGFFDHKNNFDPQQRTLGDRVARVGLQPAASAENIAMTFDVDFTAMRDWLREGGRSGANPGMKRHTYRTFAQSLVRQWMESPGHRANILNRSLLSLGVGFATMRDSRGLDRFYCVQEFCSPERQLVRQSTPGRRYVGLL